MVAWIEAAMAPWHATILAITALMYACFAILHAIATPPSVSVVMIPIALASATFATAVGLALDWLKPRTRARVLFAVAITISVNSAAHLLLDQQAHHATNLAVAILACAIFLIRIEEFVTVVAACVATFVVAAAFVAHGPAWIHFGVHMFECFAVAAVLFGMKRRICLSASRAQAAEKQLRLAAEHNAMRAERSNVAKSTFLSNMSHELRTPLNAIIGFSDILRMRTLPAPKVKDYADHVHKSGAYLLDMINQVLDLTQDDSPLAETRFDFAGFWDTTLLQVRELADAQSIRLEIAPALYGLRVTGDPRRIKAAIVQLSSNAIKFTPPLGRVSLSARMTASGDLEIVIEDQGIGIVEHDLERVFEPFYQADSDYAKRYQGMGLGLALVRQYARAHGGDVWLTSAVGKGTTARFSLPASRIEVLAKPAILAAAS